MARGHGVPDTKECPHCQRLQRRYGSTGETRVNCRKGHAVRIGFDVAPDPICDCEITHLATCALADPG